MFIKIGFTWYRYLKKKSENHFIKWSLNLAKKIRNSKVLLSQYVASFFLLITVNKKTHMQIT